MTARSNNDLDVVAMRMHDQIEQYMNHRGAAEAAGELFNIALIIFESRYGVEETRDMLAVVLELYDINCPISKTNWGFDEDQVGHA